MCLCGGQFVGCEILRKVDPAGGRTNGRIRIQSHLEVRAILADAQGDLVGENNRVDRLGVDVAEVIDDVSQTPVGVAAEIEAREPRDAILLAVGDTVEVAFHACGEVVMHQITEEFLEEAHDRECNPVGNQ